MPRQAVAASRCSPRGPRPGSRRHAPAAPRNGSGHLGRRPDLPKPATEDRRHTCDYEHRLPAQYAHSAECGQPGTRRRRSGSCSTGGTRADRGKRDDRKKRKLEAAAINRECSTCPPPAAMMAARSAARPTAPGRGRHPGPHQARATPSARAPRLQAARAHPSAGRRAEPNEPSARLDFSQSIDLLRASTRSPRAGREAGGNGGPAGRLDRPDPSTAVNALSKRR